jgi:dihydrofolate synthase/folylpolyglutamate synthase
MNYRETVQYMFERLPMFSRIGAAAIKKDLDNTLALCSALQNPQLKFPSIHVAGTNGKGSVSHMLASVLQKAGFKTGLYTSPHLKDFRERIRINGKPVEEKIVVDFIATNQQLIEKIEPSFFELTVAMAFDVFAKEQVEIAVIETGLGGRLDSTNIISPILSVITNIGFDHMQLLGNTLPEIAFEKAGIIKPNTPVVIGEQIPETKPVFVKKASDCNSKLTYAGDSFRVISCSQNELLSVEIKDKENNTKLYQLDLKGNYQQKNLLTVLQAIYILRSLGWKLSDENIKEGLCTVQLTTGLAGRWQLVHQQPQVILDVAHNADGIRQMVSQLKETVYRKLHIVIGMVNDKDISSVLNLLPADAIYYFTKAQIPRAMNEVQLQTMAHAAGLFGKHFPTVKTALSDALIKAEKEDLILVCGSVFVVGEVEVLNGLLLIASDQ